MKATLPGKKSIFLALFTFLFITATFLAQGSAEEGQPVFEDIEEGFWAEKEIETLAALNIVNGYGTEFKPSREIIRGQAANLFTSALNLPVPAQGMPFTKVSQSFENGVAATNAAGIFIGKPDGTFGVADSLTREQMASVIVRAFDLESTGEEITFTDEYKFSDSHKENIKILAQYEITTGKPDGSFDPKTAVNRAQFVAFLYRAMVKKGLINEEALPVVDEPNEGTSNQDIPSGNDEDFPSIEGIYGLNANQLLLKGFEFNTISTSDFTIEGNLITSLSIDSEKKEAVLTFKAPFAEGSTYTVTIQQMINGELVKLDVPITFTIVTE